MRTNSNIRTLEQDALAASSTQIVTRSSFREYTTEDALDIALIIIGCLSREMPSPDARTLAKLLVLRCRPSNIVEEDYREIVERIFNTSGKIAKGNPISGMF